ncbi:MAG: creatininase family protein [Chitinophagaceae bacterium]|nr:MAG: creatininase family protein [Chitinophagaceae bacterium]
MIWDTLTSGQLAQVDKNIPVLLPLAATEQHGPHLPIATDRLIGEHFAKMLNMEINDSILILPAVSIGCSDHHIEFPGTLSLKHTTFLTVVKDIIASVFHHGFYKIILFNSHGGNQGIGQVILEQLGNEYPKAHFVTVTWWVLARESLEKITETGVGGTGHACEFETSLIQLIAPELVHTGLIQKGANAPTFTWAEGDMLHGAKASYYRNMKTMTSNGIFGNPFAASAEKGKRITTCVIDSLKQVVSDLTSIQK